MTQPLISRQQRAGGDRFAKTNNLISSGAALISSAQNSLGKLESQNISTGVIIKGLLGGYEVKRGGDTEGFKSTSDAPVYVWIKMLGKFAWA